MQQVTGTVYTELAFAGSNDSMVVTSEGIVLIDSPQWPSDAVRWREAVQSKGPLRYLINTEHHLDHVAGNYFLPATVIGQQYISDNFLLSLGSVAEFAERVKMADPPGVAHMEGYTPRPPAIAFSERLTLHLGNHTIQLLHLPGHTAGETAIYVPEERVVFTGDNLVHGTLPYLADAVSVPRWLESLRVIEALEVEAIVPGHGEVCDKAGVREMIALLAEIGEAVGKAKAAGMSKEGVGEKISFVGRYPFDRTREDWIRQSHRLGIMHLYETM